MTTSDFTLAWTLALYLTCLLLAISPQPKGGSRPERARGSADGNGGLWAPQAAVPRPAKASGSLVPQPCAPADGRGNKSGFEPETYRLSRLSCRTFAANAVRLQLHVLAYNLGNFMRTLAMPKTAQPWSLTSLREKLRKIDAKVVSHGRYVTFQMAEVAVSGQMFADILSVIARLRAPPTPA